MNIINSQTETMTIKKDVTVLQLSLKRSRKGIVVSAKADPIIEELFKDWANGQEQSANAHGRYWEAHKGALPNAYGLSLLPEGKLTTPDGKVYRIDRVGVPLRDEHGINIGFLRLKGISEGDGVSFVIKGVCSGDALRADAVAVKEAVKKFYLDFVKPIDIVINMSTQEI